MHSCIFMLVWSRSVEKRARAAIETNLICRRRRRGGHRATRGARPEEEHARAAGAPPRVSSEKTDARDARGEAGRRGRGEPAATMSRVDLLGLQGKCKRDPEGYRDDVLMQLQHFNALHGLFMLKPGKDFKEFADLVSFLAQVAASYPKDMPRFHVALVDLLEKHYAHLDPSLRRSLTSALILLRNRGSVQATELLPLFFRLFRCQDKQLRVLIFRHVVADVKRANKNKRDERLNRSVQNFLAATLKDENEAAAKKALAVITELYRRNVWSDARTVNLVADACKHPAPRVMVGALKFFLGQDEAAEAAAEAGDEDEDDEDEDAVGKKAKTGVGTAAGTSSGVSKEDVYKAYNKVGLGLGLVFFSSLFFLRSARSAAFPVPVPVTFSLARVVPRPRVRSFRPSSRHFVGGR